jgi:uncharacterized protein (UPF0264 family)
MKPINLTRSSPGLLVSVRTASEAMAALEGGADIIDVKEPLRGPLGAADSLIIADVVHAVNGSLPVTAAMGELIEHVRIRAKSDRRLLPGGVSMFKLGLAGCRGLPHWQDCLRQTLETIAGLAAIARPVAVVYGDWRAARAPEPDEVLSIAIENRCPALLIDTWDKAAGSLFDCWTITSLSRFVQRVRSHDLAVVLAGSLSDATFDQAVALAPDVVAVRSAACDGGRNGTVSAVRVDALSRRIASARKPAAAVL